MQRDRLPEWAEQTKRRWIERGDPMRAKMLKALEETEIPKPAKKPAAAKADAGAESAGKTPPTDKPRPKASE